MNEKLDILGNINEVKAPDYLYENIINEMNRRSKTVSKNYVLLSAISILLLITINIILLTENIQLKSNQPSNSLNYLNTYNYYE